MLERFEMLLALLRIFAKLESFSQRPERLILLASFIKASELCKHLLFVLEQFASAGVALKSCVKLVEQEEIGKRYPNIY